MTDPSEVAHAVLIRLAQFVQQLPADQLRALADGTASLHVVGGPGPAGRAAQQPRSSELRPATALRPATEPRHATEQRRSAARASVDPGQVVDAEAVRAALASMPDRATAARHLDGLGLTATQLRAIAGSLGLAVARSTNKAGVRDTIVQWTVGRRVDGQILGRSG